MTNVTIQNFNSHPSNIYSAKISPLFIKAATNSKKTARRARSYMRAYMDDSGGSHFLIEKYAKQVKCHRNILDMDLRFLKDLDEQEKKELDKKKRDLEDLLKEMKTNHKDMKEEKVKIETLNQEVEEDKKKHCKLQSNCKKA